MKTKCIMVFFYCIFAVAPGATAAGSNLETLSKTLVRQAEDLRAGIEQHHRHPESGEELAKAIHRLRSTLLAVENKVIFGNQGSGGYSSNTSITGSCRLDVGGNFLRPDSVIHCSINGKGTVGYEVNVIGKRKEEIAFKGTLNPSLASQDFTSAEKQVGGKIVTYQVFVFTKNGHRELIHTFTPKNK